MVELSSYINEKFFLSLHASKRFVEIMTPLSFHEGELIIEKGKINNKEYLLLEGICRSYVVNGQGADITLSFFTDNSCIPPNLVRTKSDRSILNIQALTDVKLLTFPTEKLMNLMSTHREIELWANAILQKELMQKVEKEINQISLHAKERLIHFRDQYPALENILPHSYIASYLGITNVSLSRIRRELVNP